MDAMARYSSSGDPFSDKDWCLASGNEGAAVCDCACSLTSFFIDNCTMQKHIASKVRCKAQEARLMMGALCAIRIRLRHGCRLPAVDSRIRIPTSRIPALPAAHFGFEIWVALSWSEVHGEVQLI